MRPCIERSGRRVIMQAGRTQEIEMTPEVATLLEGVAVEHALREKLWMELNSLHAKHKAEIFELLKRYKKPFADIGVKFSDSALWREYKPKRKKNRNLVIGGW